MNRRQLNAISNKLILLLSFLIGFQKIDVGPLKIFDLFILLVFIWLLISRKLIVCEFPYVFMGIIFCIYLMQTVLSINMVWSLLEDIRLLFCFLSFSVFISLFSICKKESFKNILVGIFLYCVLSVVLYGIEMSGRADLNVTHGEWGLRLESLMLDPNYFAFICIFGLILLNTLMKDISKLFYAVALILFMLCVIFSGSRTAIALFVGFFFLSYIMQNKITVKTFFIIFISFIILSFSAYQLGLLDSVIERFVYQQKSGGVTEDVRFHIWSLGLRAFDEWSFGYGPGTYRYATAKFGGYHDAHNTYLWLLINNGIFFVLLLLTFLSYNFILTKMSKYGFLCVVFLLLTSLFYSMETFRVSWLFISMSYYLYFEKKRNYEVRKIYN